MGVERRFDRLFGSELQARIAERAVAWVPLGPLERHGEHLPWGLDGLKAEWQCLLLAERFGGVVLPAIQVAGVHSPWDPDPEKYRQMRAKLGDFYIRESTLEALVEDLMRELANIGFRVIVFSSGHYPRWQGRIVKELVARLQPTVDATVIAFDEADATPDLDHAGTYETSMFMALGGETHLERVKPEQADVLSNWSSKTPPTAATVEKGEAWLRQIDAWFEARLAQLGFQVLTPAVVNQNHGPLKHGRYRHYKGNFYEVMGVSRHSETMEELVVYRAMYGEFGLWVRPLRMFTERVEVGGKTVARFEYVGDR